MNSVPKTVKKVGFHRKTPKNPFFRRFLAQNVIFCGVELPFLLLAHLLQPNGQLPCKFEHHRITTAKMRSVFLELHRKTPKNPFFRRFLAQNVIFCGLELPFLLLAHLLQPTRQLPCKFDHHRITTAKLRSVFLELHRKTPKNPFFRRFLAQNVIFCGLELPFLLLAHLLQPNGQLPCKFEHHRITTAKLRSVFLELHRKTPKNPFFRRFLAQNVIFCGVELPFLILAHLLQPNGQLPCKFEHHRITTAKLRSVFLELHRKTPKNPFFRRFLAQNVIFSGVELPFLFLAHLLQPNGQLPCKFEHHRITTAKLRSVFLELHRKTPKNPFFRRFLAQNVILCGVELPFLLLAHLLQPNGQLPCKIEHYRITTAKLRSVFLELHRKTPKNPFFRRFLAQNVIFCGLELPFLLLAHLLQPNGQLPCKFEHHRITTAKMRSVFLELHRKTPKNPFFRHFLAQNVFFCEVELPFLLLAHLLKSNGQLPCKFEHHRITTAKLRSVFLELHRKTPKNPFFRRFLAQNVIFCGVELPFLLLAHLLQPNGLLSCKFEHHRITTAKMRSVFLELHRKTPKNPFFRRLLAQNVIFCGVELPPLLLAHLLQPNGQLPCKFEHHRITTAKMRSVFLEIHRKTPKNPFFRRFLAQNVIFCGVELPFLLLAHLLQPKGQLPCKFEHHRITTAKLRSVFLELHRKTQKTRFFDIFWPKTYFFVK